MTIQPNTSLIKRSQIQEKQIIQVLSNPNYPSQPIKKTSNEFDVSLYNHMSQRELSPNTSEIQI